MKNWTTAVISTAGFLVSLTCLSQVQTDRQMIHPHNPSILKTLRPMRRMAPDESMDLIFELPLRNQEEITKRLHDIYDPASQQFRQFLTPAQFTEQYGPTQKDFDELMLFVKQNHFDIINAPANRALVHVRANAKNIENIFHVKMMMYKNPENQMEFHAPVGDSYLMTGMKDLRIYGLNDFENTIPQKFGSITSPVEKKESLVGSGFNGSLMGNDFRNAYAPGVTLTGAGQVVGIVTMSDFSAADIQTYERLAGRGNTSITRVFFNGMTTFANPPPIVNGQLNANTEISMDIEMVLSMAPEANITVYGNGNRITGDLLNEIANPSMGEPLPNQVTTSFNLNYGGDDSPRVYNAYTQMIMDGQSFFAYSGDNGAWGVFATGIVLPFSPNDFPSVTSVGGTNLTMAGNGTSYVSESAWNGGGGGPSPYFVIPAYQVGLSNSQNFISSTRRNCPDVSMPASNIFIVGNGLNQMVIGGTSAATPLWAGFMALVNQQANLHQLPPVGFLNNAIYTLGRSPFYTNFFHDIQDGTGNTHPGETERYTAEKGYDLATGWGSPNGLNLINALALRTPDPLEAPINYVPVSMDGCDQGPIAGSSARYHVSVNVGAGPFTYSWKGNNGVAIELVSTSSPLNPSDVIVSIPPLGQTGNLSVVVTDANGSTFSASTVVSGIDAGLAEKNAAACRFFKRTQILFPPPVYVDPGDPYRKFQQSSYSESQLKGLQEEVDRMSGLLKTMHK